MSRYVNVIKRTTNFVTHQKVHIEHRILRKLCFKPDVLGDCKSVVYKQLFALLLISGVFMLKKGSGGVTFLVKCHCWRHCMSHRNRRNRVVFPERRGRMRRWTGLSSLSRNSMRAEVLSTNFPFSASKVKLETAGLSECKVMLDEQVRVTYDVIRHYWAWPHYVINSWKCLSWIYCAII
jgi:hypothetical protein